MDSMLFTESKLGVFQQSPTKSARSSRLCPDGATGATLDYAYYWTPLLLQTGISYDQWVEDPPNSGMGRGIPGKSYIVPIAGAVQNLRSLLGVDAALQDYGIAGGLQFATALPFPNAKSRGKWKIDFRIQINWTKMPDDTGHPARNWLFVNLRTFAKDFTVPGTNGHLVGLIRDDGSGHGVIYGGTANSGIPADANPTVDSDPNAINTTWKFDLTSITATPENPYIFTASLIVPEELRYCRVAFDLDIRSFESLISGFPPNHGSMLRSTAVNVSFPDVGTAGPSFPDQPEFCPGQVADSGWNYLGDAATGQVSPNSPSGTPTGSPDPLPGEWNVPLPNFLSSGAVAADTDLSVVDPGWGGDSQFGYTLFTSQLIASRIAPLFSLFVTDLVGANTFNFADRSLGNPVTWHWDFGDAGTSSLRNPAHTFPGAGDYNVTLTVTNGFGDTSTHSAIVTIPLRAEFVFSAQAYPQVAFTDKSLNAASYSWNFGDGSGVSTDQNPVHSFTTPNRTYTVTLTIGDGHGNTSSYSLDVAIGQALVANFTTQALASPPHTLQFTDTSTGVIVGWGWLFILGPNNHPPPAILSSTSSDQNPIVTFPSGSPPSKTVILTIRDQYGFTAQTTRNISVP